MANECGERSKDSNLSIAVAHWGEHADGGGDRLAWELARDFADAPFYVGWRDESIEPADIEAEQLIEGRLLNRALEQGGLATARAPGGLAACRAPCEIPTSSSPAGTSRCFTSPLTEQTWVAYVHHTNRRQSDQITEVESGRFPRLRLLVYYAIRVLFDHNTHRPDRFVVNSELVKRRVVRYWGVPGEKISVVYPPVDTHEYNPSDEGDRRVLRDPFSAGLAQRMSTGSSRAFNGLIDDCSSPATARSASASSGWQTTTSSSWALSTRPKAPPAVGREGVRVQRP